MHDFALRGSVVSPGVQHKICLFNKAISQTEAEKAQLITWKKYRVLLNRVDISKAPDIAWPEAPESGSQ
jgi:hypothetical protein